MEQEFVHCNTGGSRRRPGGGKGTGQGGVAGSHWDGGLNIQSTPVLSLR